MSNHACAWRRLTARAFLVATLSFVILIDSGRGQEPATPTATATGDWSFYGADLAGTRTAGDQAITAENVSQLQPLWQVEVGGPISATPVVAGGIAYVGSYDGTFYALDTGTGETVWTYDTGAAVLEPNLQIDLGITGSAAVAGETPPGGGRWRAAPEGVVYVGDAAATVHAIDAVTGTALWTVKADDQPAASIWSSPVVWNDTVYVGVASVAKQPGFRGSVVALDVASGDMRWQTYMTPEGADGAGVFAVPVIDPDLGMLYVGTQNAYSPNSAPYGNPTSIVALDAATGELAWAFNAPPGGGDTAPIDDVGFSASPNLFTVEIDGQPRDLVGEGQKSGTYWALDRETGDVVWQTEVSPAGPLGGMEGTSAVSVDQGLIAVPATNWPDPEGPAAGLVSGLDPATGEVRWTVDQTAPVASPAAISTDVVFQGGTDGFLHAYALADGTELWQADLGASVSGGIAVANGIVVLGAATPAFAPFVRPGNTIQAFALGPTPATPIPSPSPVMEKVSVRAVAADS
jgi:polyvinyl alcohol dehydrogenase (cytochrome)